MNVLGGNEMNVVSFFLVLFGMAVHGSLYAGTLDGIFPQRALFKAIERGKIEKVERLLRENTGIEHRLFKRKGTYPLHHALKNNQPNVVKLFLTKLSLKKSFSLKSIVL